LDIAERSALVAGPATALLGVSSLDLAPPAATGGAIFVKACSSALAQYRTTPRADAAVVTAAAKTKRAGRGRRASILEN
jgi:hypothetical protein